MKGTNREAAFLLRRAEEESILAIRSEQPDAAAAHQGLAILYTERARRELTNGDRADPAAEPMPMPPQRA